jgi:sulfur carrier protein
MRLTVNGEPMVVLPVENLADLLRSIGIQPDAPGIAVAVNGSVVPKSRFPEFPVTEGDRLELVRAVQGG